MCINKTKRTHKFFKYFLQMFCRHKKWSNSSKTTLRSNVTHKVLGKVSNKFLNELMEVSSLIIKMIAMSFIMLSPMIENKNIIFTVSIFFAEIIVKADHSDSDLKKKIEILVKLLFWSSAIAFNMIKFLAILQVKARKTMIKTILWKIVTNKWNHVYSWNSKNKL